MPEECGDLIPYTSYPNTRLGLYEEDDYRQFVDMIKGAAANCTDQEKIRWGVCNSVFPRCLKGFQLYMCRDVCEGKTDRSLKSGCCCKMSYPNT